MSLGYSTENWRNVLESLHFTEQRNPNGRCCYDVFNEQGIPIWQYDNERDKENLYYFFMGMSYGRQFK